jgi:hypothetical protein
VALFKGNIEGFGKHPICGSPSEFSGLPDRIEKAMHSALCFSKIYICESAKWISCSGMTTDPGLARSAEIEML